MDPLSIVSGVVGIVTFTSQVIDSIDKVKVLCKDVKDLPTDVKDRIIQIQHLAQVVQTLTHDNTHLSPEDAAIQTTLRHCRTASQQMEKSTEELRKTVSTPRSLSRLRIAANRRVIKRALQKLERSKAELQFALLFYDIACRRHDDQRMLQERRVVPQINRQAAAEAMDDDNHGVQHARTIHRSDGRAVVVDGQDGEAHRNGQSGRDDEIINRKYKLKREAKLVSTIYLRLPLWLCRASWVMSFEQGAGSWTLHLDMIDAMSRHHEVFGLCRRGDIEGVRRLLDQRVVSLHAQDEDGKSLTRVALAHFQTDLAEFLVDRGARIEAPSRSEYFNHDGYWNCRYEYLRKSDDATTDIFEARILRHMRFISEVCALEDIVSGHQHISATDCISTAPSRWTRQIAMLKHEDVFIYMLNAMVSFPRDVTVLKGDFFALRTAHDQTLAQHCTMSFLHMLGMVWHMDGVPGYDSQIGLTKDTLLQGISQGVDLNVMNESGRTPFMALLEHAVGLGIASEWNGTTIVDHLVYTWLSCLASGNVDLEQYAKVEHQRFREMDQQDDRWWREDGVIGFSSGPRPADWHAWSRHPGDVFCGIFWGLVENPTRTMPGTYPDPGGHDLDLDKWTQDARSVRPRKSGLKAKTLRWIDSTRRSERSGQTVEARHAMEHARRIALRNARAWQAGDIGDEDDKMHEKLLDAMTNAALDRPDRVGMRASLWRFKR